MLSLLMTAALAQEPACDEPTDTLQVVSAIERAENAWSMADAKNFNDANRAMATLLPCLEEPLTRSMAARVHRMNGLSHFLNRNDAEMQLSFAAARATAPAFRWPADLVPPDHPVLDGYNAMDTTDLPTEVTLAPKDGSSSYDGREGLARPTSVPTLHQHLGDDGSVLGTWLLNPGDPLPDYPRVSPSVAATPSGEIQRRGARLPMLLGAAGGFAASGVMYGLAASASGSYRSGEVTSIDELDRLRGTTNSAYWASVGLVGASTVTTIGAFAVARW